MPLLHSLSIPTKRVITISSSVRPSCTPFLATVVAEAPRRRRCYGHGHRRMWPGHLKPSRAKPWAPGDGMLPCIFHDAGDDLTGRKSAGRRSSSASSVLIGVEDLTFK